MRPLRQEAGPSDCCPESLYKSCDLTWRVLNNRPLLIHGWAQKACFMDHHAAPTPQPCHRSLPRFNRTKAMGPSSVFPGEDLSGLPFVPGYPVPCLAVPAPWQKACTSYFKSQGRFFPSFFFFLPWFRFRCRTHPKEHSPPELQAVQSGRSQGRLERFLFPEGPLTSSPQLRENIESFTATQGQAFSL